MPVTTLLISCFVSKLISLCMFMLSAALGSFQLVIISPVMGGNSGFACLQKPSLFSSCSSHSVMKTAPRLGCFHWSPASSISGIEGSLV